MQPDSFDCSPGIAPSEHRANVIGYPLSHCLQLPAELTNVENSSEDRTTRQTQTAEDVKEPYCQTVVKVLLGMQQAARI